jgi:hypothetical protein
MASGVYPASVSSSASDTRMRVPLKIKRPRQTRLSAARCLPISTTKCIPAWQYDQKVLFSQRRRACRPACPTTHEVCVCDQPQRGETDRPNDPA